jgi:hypothetical protein
VPSDATGHRTFFEECIHCLEVVFQCRPVQRRLSVPPHSVYVPTWGRAAQSSRALAAPRWHA